MPLDEATRRFSFLLQGDLRRMTERHEEHTARGEQVKFDSVSRIALMETRRGDTASRLYGEVLATYAPHDRILRWAWAGRSPSASATHGDVVFREGQARGVPQLTMSVVGDLDETDAGALVRLGALVARAEGVHERKVAGDTEYIGLFERPRPSSELGLIPAQKQGPSDSGENHRYSVPPPAVTERSERSGGSVPPPRAYRSIPPIREIYEPRATTSRPPPVDRGDSPGGTAGWSNLDRPRAHKGSVPPPPSGEPRARQRSSPPPVRSSLPTAPEFAPVVPRKLREPSRSLFLPVANAALAALARGSKGYLQGLFVLTLDSEKVSKEPRRLMVQLVVIDVAGMLRALDPPLEVIEAAAAMVEADRIEGNGTWRKLSARITPKSDGGATLNVDVL